MAEVCAFLISSNKGKHWDPKGRFRTTEGTRSIGDNILRDYYDLRAHASILLLLQDL